ncbi:MAG: hypothetical protein M3R07_04490 [Gemmatimonadota bacterium]|nr:hypothetical protein [Gemmatimonadota bacterium]
MRMMRRLLDQLQVPRAASPADIGGGGIYDSVAAYLAGKAERFRRESIMVKLTARVSGVSCGHSAGAVTLMEIGVLAGAAVLIAAVLWYFFGDREKVEL